MTLSHFQNNNYLIQTTAMTHQIRPNTLLVP